MVKSVQMKGKPGRAPSPDAWVNEGAENPNPPSPDVGAVSVDQAKDEPKEKMKRLTIDVEPTLHRRLKVACAQSGQKMADFVRDLLDKNVP